MKARLSNWSSKSKDLTNTMRTSKRGPTLLVKGEEARITLSVVDMNDTKNSGRLSASSMASQDPMCDVGNECNEPAIGALEPTNLFVANEVQRKFASSYLTYEVAKDDFKSFRDDESYQGSQQRPSYLHPSKPGDNNPKVLNSHQSFHTAVSSNSHYKGMRRLSSGSSLDFDFDEPRQTQHSYLTRGSTKPAPNSRNVSQITGRESAFPRESEAQGNSRKQSATVEAIISQVETQNENMDGLHFPVDDDSPVRKSHLNVKSASKTRSSSARPTPRKKGPGMPRSNSSVSQIRKPVKKDSSSEVVAVKRDTKPKEEEPYVPPVDVVKKRSRHDSMIPLNEITPQETAHGFFSFDVPQVFLQNFESIKSNKSKKVPTHTICAQDFYAEHCGHPYSYLKLIHLYLKRTKSQFIWLVGDGTIDNKHWLYTMNKKKLGAMHHEDYTRDAVNGYGDVLNPRRMVMDVNYWMNVELEKIAPHMASINFAIDETGVSERVDDIKGWVKTSKAKMKPQDQHVIDYVGPRDTIVCSVGGFDIAGWPSSKTIGSIISVLGLGNEKTISDGTAMGMAQLIKIFKDKTQAYIELLTSKTRPKRVVISMVYYLDENADFQGWASNTFSIVGASAASRLDLNKLRLIVKSVYKLATCQIKIPGIEIIPCPLFDVLDGKDSRDYACFTQPSIQGSGKIARKYIQVLAQSGYFR